MQEQNTLQHAVINQASDSKIDLSNDMNIPQEGVHVGWTRQPPILFDNCENDHLAFVSLMELMGLPNELQTYETTMLSIDK